MDLRRLEDLAKDLINNSLAPSTRRVYASGQKRYLEFCKNSSLSPFPLSENLLCTFVAYLMDEGLQYTLIKGYLSAIRRLQIVQGPGDPFAASWPLLEYTLRGIKLHQAKERKSRSKKRLPITLDIFRKLKEVWSRNAHQVDNIMLWAVCCMGEVTLTSGQEYDPEADLSEGDVALDDLVNPTVVRVHIKASKTDPFRQGVYVYLGATENDLCLVAAVAAYLAVRGRSHGPFFRFASGTALTWEGSNETAMISPLLI